MKRVFATTLVPLLLAACVAAVAARSPLALLYVPANLLLPVLVAVALYHRLVTRYHFTPYAALPLFAAAYAAVVSIMFAVDVFFVNPQTPAQVIFNTDYRGWVLPSLVVVVTAPAVYRFMRLRSPAR